MKKLIIQRAMKVKQDCLNKAVNNHQKDIIFNLFYDFMKAVNKAEIETILDSLIASKISTVIDNQIYESLGEIVSDSDEIN